MTAPDEVLTVAARYGVARGAVREVPGGVANRVFVLGNDLVLRMPRALQYAADLRKEVAVIPVARAAGVRTPDVVEVGGAGDTPYVVMERLPGNDLLAADPHPAAWAELGRQVWQLHATAPRSIDGVPTEDGGGNPRAAVEEVASAGLLDVGTARWLTGWFGRLSGRFDRNAPMVLLHGDLALQNVMVDADGRYLALIDWGDATWGPAGMEFAKLRLEEVAKVLPYYAPPGSSGRSPNRPGREEEHEQATAGEELAAAVLWFHLSWGVSGLARSPRPGQRHWTAAPAARLLGVLRFFASGPPEPWRGLGYQEP